jgi:hypothetical protein
MDDLISQRTVSRVIGASRLRRLLHAGWIEPVERSPQRVLFRISDIHLALSRLEREACPPNRIEVGRVRACEARNGRAYVKKGQPQRPALDAIELDFSTINL